jgi:hypothetical protein
VEKLPAKQPNTSGPLPDNSTDASLQLDYASFIDQAMQTPQTDTDAIQRAQELLLSGRIESPENVRVTAENIVEFGI